jgi:hypothetical protein
MAKIEMLVCVCVYLADNFYVLANIDVAILNSIFLLFSLYNNDNNGNGEIALCLTHGFHEDVKFSSKSQ